MKANALLQLARLRQSTRLDGYASLGDFHDGIFECDHVSPWTKSGCNVDAKIMVVGQDWSSGEVLGKNPPDSESAELGFSPKFPTNRNLDILLDRYFGLKRAECYLTNLFPFIKPGNASAAIPLKNLVACAQQFTLPEIQIVSPQLVICLGLRSFLALMRAVGHKGSPKMDQAVNSPFKYVDSMIYCIPHTGALGMNNRGRDQVDRDWQKIASLMPINLGPLQN
jgi:restriction system protein